MKMLSFPSMLCIHSFVAQTCLATSLRLSDRLKNFGDDATKPLSAVQQSLVRRVSGLVVGAVRRPVGPHSAQTTLIAHFWTSTNLDHQ